MKANHLSPLKAALCTAALIAASWAHAQSSVTIYGIVSQDAVRVTNSLGARYRLDNGALNASRLGFKGQEDLGGGISAIFDLESGISPDTGTANGGGTFWNRGSYVGLKSGSFGSLTLGRQWNVNDDILGNFFIFGGYAVFGFGGFDYTSDLVDNSVKYVSPSFGGFGLEALGAPGEGGPRTLELAGTYAGGPLKAALTYHESKDKALGLKDKLTSAGISYAFGDFKARLAYSSANNALSASGLGVTPTPGVAVGEPKASAFDVGVDFGIDAYALSLDYVNRDLKDSSDDSHFIRLLGTYNFSKRTQLNANVVYLKNKGAATQGFFGGVDGPGKSQTVLGLGLSHFF